MTPLSVMGTVKVCGSLVLDSRELGVRAGSHTVIQGHKLLPASNAATLPRGL